MTSRIWRCSRSWSQRSANLLSVTGRLGLASSLLPAKRSSAATLASTCLSSFGAFAALMGVVPAAALVEAGVLFEPHAAASQGRQEQRYEQRQA